IPFEKRLEYIFHIYGSFDKTNLVNSIMKIQKRLGGQETKNAVNYLLESNLQGCFNILLHYYDKLYKNALEKREDLETLLTKIPVASIDPKHFATLVRNHQKRLSENPMS
ncbi:MAG: hypothetical protein ABIO82_07170, partial [Ginsengibacter sp.]